MTVHQVKNSILNDILKHLESKPQPVVLSAYLKSIGIENPGLVKFYEAKLNQDGHINLKSFSSDRKHAMISDKGRVFINEGGYKNSAEKTNGMTKERIMNTILREMHDENEGRVVSDIADNLGVSLNAEQIKEVEVQLYSDGYVTTRKLPDGVKVLHLTEKGYDFISNGGYKSKAEESLTFSVQSAVNKMSKAHQDRKKPHEIKAIYQKIQSIFDDLISKIGVISDTDLKVATASLVPLYEELYGKLSTETGECKSVLKDMTTCRKDILHFLKDTLTRLELKLQLINLDIHPKVKAVSEQLFIDGHYRQAVLDAFILVDNTVQSKTASSKTGKTLMEEAFSVNNPKIQFSSDNAEQLGMMQLYSAAIMGIRNRYAHKTIKLTDKNYAADLLHFASALMRLLDNQTIY